MNVIFNPIIALLFFPGGVFLLMSGLFFEWADRKLVARFQNRLGPRWFQPLADFIKLLAKEEIIPEGVHAGLFVALPVVAENTNPDRGIVRSNVWLWAGL